MKTGALVAADRLAGGRQSRLPRAGRADLGEITGKQLMPNPAASSTVRKQNVRRWRDRLEAGELKPVSGR